MGRGRSPGLGLGFKDRWARSIRGALSRLSASLSRAEVDAAVTVPLFFR